MAASASPHAQLIQASWARCREHGLHPQHAPDFDCLTRAELSALLERRQALLHLTREAVLPQYAHLLGNASYLVMLADASGCLLDSWGSRRFIEPRQQHGFSAGAHWHERGVGTNALGTALVCAEAIHVGQEEHFLRQNRYMSSAAAPLFDAERQLVGVLDVASDGYLPASQTLGLVRMMGQSLENRLILAKHADQHAQLIFNSASDNLDSPWAGLLVFDEQGQVLAANHRADTLLGGNPLQQNIAQLFQLPLQQLLSHPRQQPFALQATGRNRFHCQWQPPREAPGRPAASSAEPRLEKALAQAGLLLEKDIPVLVQGETGVGKEVFVDTLHRASSRASQPLIAVNCAAIPAELVESELFGYDKGAFTGAHQKGNPGLIRKAHHGILFLDEIGDMPLPTQARLLRVLQTRSIQPLGSGEPVAVDIRVVSASNRDLAEEVRAGRFRQDLYYRIAGLAVVLPPLRERNDRRQLIEQVHARYRDPGQPARLPAAIIELLDQHPWPGNMRELVSVLQVALALAGNGPVGLEHLPAGFLAEAQVPVPIATEEADLRELVAQANGNLSAVARGLGISRTTLYKRLRER
ncbi:MULTISPECIES: sigma-54-dependent Fis family transcriptional regulator [Pseudomonas]|uniref:Sigma-54-dependent Fis family transcriptional regulator n=1 Tax=Pseudomonas shirazica TaxID=1940636 RepID=A0ABY9STG7_9PSED|nr:MULTISPECIES: sigma-54-dependent Fis family transcriptional regulator [Pseudomonas]CAB5644638.1 Acetoin catabolism regulatory protein [Pseudomonas putida]MBO2924636.1 sigma-54-dependent Fis family transcriptional regulator [Pseudomonas asiatica]PJI71414.1 sigma-54-dependent Fis family transcriptional regulator [Pseudomonas sp. MR 02]WMY86786.1 sigma-54-dependent Fis family transcriptional regulator [Pseudomonas shirazica]WPU58002.1 sigma-54-dependent Fis family transcriptional regulator [Ps